MRSLPALRTARILGRRDEIRVSLGLLISAGRTQLGPCLLQLCREREREGEREREREREGEGEGERGREREREREREKCVC